MSQSIYIEPTHIFLADVHLGGSTLMGGNYEHSLCSLINYAAKKKIQLYLLGDVFDYWMEFPAQTIRKTPFESSQTPSETTLPPLGSIVLDTLKKYNQECGPAYYILGNHDYWDAGYFTSIGCKVFDDGCKIDLDRQTVCLLHGDGLPTKKTTIHGDVISPLKRPMLHTILRSASFITLFQYFFTPIKAWSIMKSFSNFSKKKEKPAQVIIDSAYKNLIKFYDIDVIIAGHDHLARTVHSRDGQYINTGPYYENNLVLTYSKQGWVHAEWEDRKSKLVVKEKPSYAL
jgi:UDP-2,3-diacylglucosamine hydrolase